MACISSRTSNMHSSMHVTCHPRCRIRRILRVIPRRWLLLLLYNRTKTEIGAGIASERESAVVIETGMRTVAMLREIQKETGTDIET